MLALTLTGLEQDGLVSRTMYPTIPPRVDYELTDLGRSLIVPLRSLRNWAVEHRPAMLAAREELQNGSNKLGSGRSASPIRSTV
jgi:DNA-binding HxlR family transcriptional regulator